jgi:RNA polymerase sigma-70 factor (ECF subfamily)
MSDTVQLLERIQQGDALALEQLLDRHRPLIREFIERRLDPALRNRVDPSDIVQETQLEIARRLKDYLDRNPMPFQIWLRKTAYQNLARIRRHHLQAEQRDCRREVNLPQSVSLLLVDHVVGNRGGSLEALVRQEMATRVKSAVESLSELDQEVLMLRAYEGLDNNTVAAFLEIAPRASSKRYARALLRLRSHLLGSDSPLDND